MCIRDRVITGHDGIIKKAKDYIAIHKIAAVTTATTAAAGENIKSGL